MTMTKWSALALALLAGCGRKTEDTGGGQRSFSLGLIGTHGPKVEVRLEVPKGWKVARDPYGASLRAPGASELNPTVHVNASGCDTVRDSSTLKLRPATPEECLTAKATVVPGSPPSPPVETTAAGPRVVVPGARGDKYRDYDVAIITLTPDRSSSLSCIMNGAGDATVLHSARATCDGLVAGDPVGVDVEPSE
ncbi:MAG: hypothetical protein IT370_02320 [Deltaproteobacteria bacterium]|nr:hypothetical protein [Deltaproteobacteria bacterium]